MTINDYQKEALSTAFPQIDEDIPYLTLAMCGEAGEVADKVKKVIRDHGGNFDDILTRSQICHELGDVLWYAAVLAKAIGYDLEEVAKRNLIKIQHRQQRGTIHGSGDTR